MPTFPYVCLACLNDILATTVSKVDFGVDATSIIALATRQGPRPLLIMLTVVRRPSYASHQELLTELPNDTCAIPEPLDIPAIPEAEDRNDSAETPPASASTAIMDVGGLDASNISGADQTRVHAGRDRSACSSVAGVGMLYSHKVVGEAGLFCVL